MSTRYLLVIFLILASGAASSEAQDPKPKPKPVEDLSTATPAFKVTMSALAKEFNRDTAAASKKYADKVLEVSGTIRFFAPPGEAAPSRIYFRAEGTTIPCWTADDQPWAKATPGQEITIRGRFIGKGNYMVACAIVKTDASPAITLTPADLVKEYVADREATVKKYDDKYLIVTGEIVDLDFSSAGACRVNLKKEGNIQVFVTFSSDARDLSRKLKAGEKLTAIGKLDKLGTGKDEVGLYDCLPIRQP